MVFSLLFGDNRGAASLKKRSERRDRLRLQPYSYDGTRYDCSNLGLGMDRSGTWWVGGPNCSHNANHTLLRCICMLDDPPTSTENVTLVFSPYEWQDTSNHDFLMFIDNMPSFPLAVERINSSPSNRKHFDTVSEFVFDSKDTIYRCMYTLRKF